MAKKSKKAAGKPAAKAKGTAVGGSPEEQIAQKEKEIEQLKADIEAARHPLQEFPKYVMDPDDPTRGRVVNNEEEESAAKKGKGPLVPKSNEITTTETLVEDVDAQAAGAHGEKKKVTTRTKTYATQEGKVQSGDEPKGAKGESKGKAKGSKAKASKKAAKAEKPPVRAYAPAMAPGQGPRPAGKR
jgi:hypothetical protein